MCCVWRVFVCRACVEEMEDEYEEDELDDEVSRSALHTTYTYVY